MISQGKCYKGYLDKFEIGSTRNPEYLNEKTKIDMGL